MASPNPQPSPPSPAFDAAFSRAAGPSRTLRFDAFMALALYDPQVGYYRADRLRVGRDRSADFYTATSLGPIFGELVAAAASKLLRAAGLDPAVHTFVEIGAEPSGGILAGVAPHPFAAIRTLRVGQPLALAGPCVVFSNELFDAQPVRRFIRRATAWHELGVMLANPGNAGVSPAPTSSSQFEPPSPSASSAPSAFKFPPSALPSSPTLAETDLGPVSTSDTELLARLPPFDLTPENYQFDAPLAATALARDLAAQPWHGLFIAFDYGKSSAELGHSHPAGSARAYFQHTQHNDLLARPGEQDLTAHVCWDWLADALHAGGCTAAEVASQESFFVHHAGDFIGAALARSASSAADPRKRAIMHLLHPAQMGQKFQVLHALRPAASHTSSPSTV